MDNPLDIAKITICLEQKILFITTIYNTTKQIEVKAQQEEIELQFVLNERASCIKRVDMCDNLIKQVINESDDEQAKIIINNMLSRPKNIILDKLSDNYKEIGRLSLEYVRILENTIELDKKATSIAKSRYEDVKAKLAKLRNPANKNMFKV